MNIQYEQRKVILSRLYPFGEKVKAKVKGKTKEVTVVTVNELTGADDEALLKQDTQSAYAEIAVACGLTIEEARKLARSDAYVINEVQQSFLFDSAEIVEID